MALDIRWQEVDQLIYPGQQVVVVGWSTNEGAPQLRVYRSSGLKQFTSHDAGELVVDKVGDWSPAAEDQEDLADVLYGLERLFLELAKLQKAERVIINNAPEVRYPCGHYESWSGDTQEAEKKECLLCANLKGADLSGRGEEDG
jgi:hypothetical protein